MAKSKQTITKKKTGTFNKRIPYLLVAAISALIYLNTVPNDYNLDDELVTLNQRLTKEGISAIPEIFKEPYYKDKAGYAYEYRPIVLVSFAIEHSFFGEHASVSHFINVLLYTLLCVLLLYYLSLLLKDFNPLVPLLITLFFAVHPIHTEVVASIKNRDEILALLFAILAGFFALRFYGTEKWYWVPLMAVSFLLSLLSKQTTVVFIALIPFAIAVFRTGGIFRLTIILFVLGLVAVPVINIKGIALKTSIVIAAYAFVLLIYFLKNNEQINVGVRSLFNSLKSYAGNKSQPSLGLEQTEVLWEFDSRELLMPKYYFVFVLPVILLVLLDYFATFIWNPYLMYASIAVLWVLLFRSQPRGKFIALIGLFIVLLNLALLNGIQEKFTYYIFIVLSVLLFFYASRPFKWLSVVLVIICAALLVLRIHDPWFPLLIAVFALFGREGKLKVFTYAGFGIMGISLVYFIYAALLLKKVDYSYFSFFLPMLLAIMYFRYRKSSFNMVLASMVFFLALSNVMVWATHNGTWPGTPGNMMVARVKAVELARKDVVNINPENVNRPLRYMEIPVSLSDPLSVRLGTASDILLRYLKLVVIPYPMAFYYGYSCIQAVPLFSAVSIISILIHLILLFTGFYLIKREPLIAFGILLYLVGISIYTNLLMPVPGMLANRFLFIPSLGFCFVLVAVILKLAKVSVIGKPGNDLLQGVTPVMKYSVLSILLLSSLMTVARNTDWKDYITLFRHDIKVVENSAQAQNLLGLHLFLQSNKEQDPVLKQQMREEAIPHFKKAIEIYPGFLNASFDLARMLNVMGRNDEAYEQFRITCAMDSNFISPYFAMGIIEQNKGNYETAIAHYKKFLTKYPYNMEGYANLSFAYFKAKQYDQSIATNHLALRANPGTFDPTVNIAKTYLEMGQKDSALVYFKQAQKINPAEPNVTRLIDQLQGK